MKRVVFAAFACALVGACGGSGNSSVAGTYRCTGVGLVETIELRADGQLFANSSMLNQHTSGTYRLDGDRIVAVVNGREDVMTIVNGELHALGGRCVKQ